MRRLSVKARLTLWITLMMLLLVAAVLAVLVTVSSSVVTESAYDQLESTVRANLNGISHTGGTLSFQEGFAFTKSGVYTLVYSRSGALLAGQPPLSFPENEPFENGVIRPVSADGTYYILDFWLPFSWDDGVWVRGMMEAPETAGVLDGLAGVALLLLPLMVAVSGLGSYLLARATFRPISRIIAAAEAIGEGRDLSRRIGLPAGHDEISRLAAAFDRMFARLEAAFEAEQRFTSDASHELRTPTAVILAQCREARNHAQTTGQYAQAVDVIERQAGKMSALIGQLLQMTRLEQGTLPAAMEEADLSELVDVICREQPQLPQGITLTAEFQPELRACFDVTLMSRLLQNLLDNAARYGRPDGHIWVSLRQEGADAVLCVRDDGIGISADQLPRIWQRFYQVDPARSGQNGSGLGLTMVQQIAALHGGSVTVESRPGEGSCFTLRFPVSRAPDGAVPPGRL